MTTQYINPWHHPNRTDYGPSHFTTEALPTAYSGFQIFQRIEGHVWDVVKNGRCVAQRAGINGAKRAIDELNKATP